MADCIECRRPLATKAKLVKGDFRAVCRVDNVKGSLVSLARYRRSRRGERAEHEVTPPAAA
jgi:hypothetical protein